MKMMNLDNALREERRNPDAYLDQGINLLRGAIRFAGWWATATIVSTAGVAMVAFLAMDLSALSLPDMQQALRLIVTGAGCAAALAGLLCDVARFRNMFSDRAIARVQRFEALKAEAESQTEITERLLVSYQLVSEADVEQRRARALEGTQREH